MNNGRILKKKRPFTQVSNYALRDPKLSLKAKGLYALINSYIDIPDFTLYKSFLMTQCLEGKSAFQSSWDELKEKGYLIQKSLKDEKGHWIYEYELLDCPYTENRDTDNPDLDKQSTGKPDTVNQEGNNTEEIKELLSLLNINDAAALLRLPEKYECSFEMLYYAIGIAYKNKPKNPIGYINNIFLTWNLDRNKTLADLKVSLCSKEEAFEAISLYQEQIKNEQTTDFTNQFYLLTKMFTFKDLKSIMRDCLIRGRSINTLIPQPQQ